MIFPTRQGEWSPSALILSKLHQVYGTQFVMDEAEKAIVWLMANPRRLKTDRGMQRFLVNWLNTAQKQAQKRPKEAGIWMEPSAIPDDEVARMRAKMGLHV